MVAGRFDIADPIARIEAFGDFGDWWFEHDSRPRMFENEDTDAMVDALGADVPAVLRHFYRRVKQWPIERMFMFNQNRLVRPDQLGARSERCGEGLLVFAYENQENTWWAIPLSGGSDPAVYSLEYQDHHAEVGDEPHDYEAGRCSLSLADFLIGFFLQEFFLEGERIGNLTLFQDHFETHPDEVELLHPNAFGFDIGFHLWSKEILTMTTRAAPRIGRWTDEIVMLGDGRPEATARCGVGRDLMQQFAGHLAVLSVTWMVGAAPRARKIVVSIDARGNGRLVARDGGEIKHDYQFVTDTDPKAVVDALTALRQPDTGGDLPQLRYRYQSLVDEPVNDGPISRRGFADLVKLAEGAIREESDELSAYLRTHWL